MKAKLNKYVLAMGIGISSSLLVPMSVLAADDTKGVMRGSVVGESGSALAGAEVVITNKEKGTTRKAKVNSKGVYTIPALTTGTYSVQVVRDGSVVSEQEDIVVTIGEKTVVNFNLSASMTEEMVVTGTQTKAIDTSSAVKDFVVDTTEFMARVPVARDLTSVAMLAPTAVVADRTFAATNHDAPALSLGGGSPAENACFINGLNTTNFRNGLGCSQVPFEFYDAIQIKNGGYNAEFGRSIGGVMNATTKSGSNEFHGGINFRWEPSSLQGDYKSTYRSDGKYLEEGSSSADIWGSGAIVQDKLFFYGLISPTKRKYVRELDGQVDRSEWDDTAWALKLDYFITDNHSLEYTGFDDTRKETENTYGTADNKYIGTTVYSRGGRNHAFKYTGSMTDWLTVNAQYGINEYDRTDRGSTDGNPVIIDDRTGTPRNIGNWANAQPSEKFDERKAARLDFDFYLGSHNVRAGLDFETNTATEKTIYSGGVYHRYLTIGETSKYNGAVGENGYVYKAGDELTRVRYYLNEGSFETLANAWYIQDEWTVNDRVTLHFGIRNESFNNKNADGDSFIKVDNQWAPRLGASFDPTGNGSSRIFANWGRYYLPIAANTNIRMAGRELFTEEYFRLDNLNDDDTPVYDPATKVDEQVFSDGKIADTRSVLDQNIKPMYQDEIILGYEFDITEDWRLTAKYTQRDLGDTIEDVAIDAAVIDHYDKNGWKLRPSDINGCEDKTTDGSTIIRDCGVKDFFGGFHQYVLTNPGAEMAIYIPEQSESINLSPKQLQYPKPQRKFQAIELSFDRAWDGKWLTGGSIVLSKTEGNHEGYVKSDNGQDDAGITTSFDQPGLTDGSYGRLPSDRPWALKTWGSYQMTEGLRLGANLSARAGRPVNCIGVHPTDDFAAAYGAESFYCNGKLVPRGSAGRTPNSWELDLSARYAFDLAAAGELIVRADIFNVFNNSETVEVNELGELEDGSANPNYLKPTAYQLPRYVRFTASYAF